MAFNKTLTRTVPYWVTSLAATWIVIICYTWNIDEGYNRFDANVVAPVFAGVKSVTAVDWGLIMMNFVAPLLLAACFSYLVLTNAVLPAHKLAFVNKFFNYIRSYPLPSAEEGHQLATAKKNQFLLGEVNFDVMALWLIGLPTVIGYLTWTPVSQSYVDEESALGGWDQHRIARQRCFSVSMMSGWMGIFALSWFLIPVARHSVLLVAMGWSPVQALRIHIWSGHLAFFFVALHAITMPIVWFMDPWPVIDSIIPRADCWAWGRVPPPPPEDDEIMNATSSNTTGSNETSTRMLVAANDEYTTSCNYQWFNLTGIVAMIFFTVLWVSSLHWFRRRNYRLFYLIHVVFGSLMLISSLIHYGFMIMYWLPSILYYLASTSPTLIQAIAARKRGGVKITKVLPLDDSGGCVEVHVVTTKETASALNTEPSQFVKLCVPKISIVWHPFTVFAHPDDPATLRFLFRPVGSFTKQFAETLLSPTRPVTILDGFYKGSNRCQEALIHDTVTIVSGGVALTPFLSMIPALLNSISKLEDEPKTHTIAIHWACREYGLLKHVMENYFDLYLEQAKELKRVRLAINIYYTGKNESVLSILGKHEDASALDQTMPINDESSDPSFSSGDKNLDNSDKSVSFKELDGDSMPPKDMADMPSSISDNQSVEDKVNVDVPGIPMELGRMMAGRYKQIWSNIPVLFAFSIPLFCIWAFMVETYDINQYENFEQMVATAAFVLAATALFFLFAVGVEFVVLHFGKFWPAEKLDDFDLYLPVPKGYKAQESDLESSFSHWIAQYHSEYAAVHVVGGRPTGPMVMAVAQASNAPGIFMCGPAKMVEMVKKETNQENSWLGMTRYCIYNEEFEM